MVPDYYSILRIDATASLTAVKAAYRVRALACHPDRGGRHEEMVLVNEAWEILGDPERRRRYDAERQWTATQPQSPFSQDVAAARARAAVYPARWMDFEKWLNDVAQDFRAVEWTTTNAAFWQIPVSRRSASAKIFVTIGAVACSLGDLVIEMRRTSQGKNHVPSPARLYGLGTNPVNPLNPRRNNPLAASGLPNTSGQQASPSQSSFHFRLCLSGICGAWLGKWLHVTCVRWLSSLEKKS